MQLTNCWDIIAASLQTLCRLTKFILVLQRKQTKYIFFKCANTGFLPAAHEVNHNKPSWSPLALRTPKTSTTPWEEPEISYILVTLFTPTKQKTYLHFFTVTLNVIRTLSFEICLRRKQQVPIKQETNAIPAMSNSSTLDYTVVHNSIILPLIIRSSTNLAPFMCIWLINVRCKLLCWCHINYCWQMCTC